MRSLYPILNKVLLLAIMLGVASFSDAQDKKNAVSAKEKGSSITTDKKADSTGTIIKVKGRSDRKVGLTWAPFIGDVSHYVLERSTDGRRFNEIAVFFTGDSGQETMYDYTDKFKAPYGGVLYYRLRVEGLDGSELYTPVTILKAVQF